MRRNGVLKGGHSLLLLNRADSGYDNGEVSVFGDHGRAATGAGVVEDPLDLRARPEEGNDRRHAARHRGRDPDGCRSANDYFVTLFGIGARVESNKVETATVFDPSVEKRGQSFESLQWVGYILGAVTAGVGVYLLVSPSRPGATPVETLGRGEEPH